jgi:hypothetical protein
VRTGRSLRKSSSYPRTPDLPLKASPILLVASLLVVLAGCGSSRSASAPTRGSAGITVGTCLNDQEHFLVQPHRTVLDGQSPAGVSFTLTLYKTDAAAAAAFAKQSPRTTSLVENGVIDFRGNPPISAGGPPAKLSRSELSAITRCIDSTKAAGK